MGKVLVSDNGNTTLAVDIPLTSTTQFTVSSAAAFPAVTTASGNWFYCTLSDNAGGMEIVKVTDVTGVAFTCTRGIGGTAKAFTTAALTKVQLRPVSWVITDLQAGSAASTFDMANATAATHGVNRQLGDARFAALAGLNTQTFDMANATAATHGVNRQLGDARYIMSGAAAGADLTGVYPNPTLAATGPGNTGPCGSGTTVPVITIDTKGRVTALSSTPISSVMNVVARGHITGVQNGGHGGNETQIALDINSSGFSIWTNGGQGPYGFYLPSIGGGGGYYLITTTTSTLHKNGSSIMTGGTDVFLFLDADIIGFGWGDSGYFIVERLT